MKLAPAAARVVAIPLKKAAGLDATLGVDLLRVYVVQPFHPRMARDRRCRPAVPDVC